jgi:proteasome accessory factor A
MRRIMGTEVEYGIAVPGDPSANPDLTSTRVVLAYAADAPHARRTRWDYEAESPLRDARGFDLAGPGGSGPDHDVEDHGAANVILTNGARLYVDHGHPEYAAPEVTTARDAVIWDKAGVRVMGEAARKAAAVPGQLPLQLYKNNVDGKGASYGTHENYLMARSTPFSSVVSGLIPFFVSRQVVTGSGRVGIGQQGEEPGFQLSQRSDYIEVEVGLETMLKRGIINTRDEPHANAAKYRRLHVIIGDANLAEYSTFLKFGTTALVLDMIEAGQRFDGLRLDEPVRAVRQISRDPTLRTKVAVSGGKELTGLEIQFAYHELASAHLERGGGDEQAKEVLRVWGEILDALARDPQECADRLDWVAKLRLLEGYRQRDQLDWGAPRLQLVDLQYSDMRRDKGLHNRLVASGAMKRLVSEDEVRHAIEHPPEDTRAYFRGRVLEKYASSIAAVSWSSVVFDVGRESLVRIPTLEPLRGTKAHIGRLLDTSPTAAKLVEALTGSG